MSANGLQILLCTNGSDESHPALEYGVWLAKLLNLPVQLLGVIEGLDSQHAVQKQVRESEQMFQSAGIQFQVEIAKGRGSVVIGRYASQSRYITVVGPLGRPLWRRLFQGRSFRRLLKLIQTPLIYVPRIKLPLTRLLLCMGGLGYAHSVKQQCIILAKATGAKITVLHIVEPANLDYPVAREMHLHWKNILETETPQGRNLRQALHDIEIAGIEVTFKVRNGNPVHEIIAEYKKGAYDLIGLGSPHSAHSLRHLYLPNVTAEVAETAECPVITARALI